MRRTLAVAFALALVVPGAGAGLASAQADGGVDCTYPITLTDATGTDVTVPAEPERVVVLSHSTAQTMWAIGAEDRVVGMPIDPFSSYLPGRESKTNVVDDRSQPVPEKVVSATPDLVIAGNNVQPPTINATRNAVDAPVYRAHEATSLAVVAEKTERIGQLVGAFEPAARQAAMTRGNVSAVRDAVADRDRPTVYYAMGGGFTAGTQTFIGNTIEMAGGRNVAAAANITGYGEISQEVIAAEDPDWVVVTEGASVPQTAALNDSTAVQEDQILRVNANFLNQPGPKNVIPLRQMARAFHTDVSAADLEPTEYPEPTKCASALATPTATATPTPTADGGGDGMATTQPTTTTEASGGGGPGFGPVVAATAVAAAAAICLLARRD